MAAKDDYRTKMQQLQTLLFEMQSEELDVDSVIAKYENGKKIIRELQKYLESAENKITKRVLSNKLETK